jgi:hypothetical protein
MPNRIRGSAFKSEVCCGHPRADWGVEVENAAGAAAEGEPGRTINAKERAEARAKRSNVMERGRPSGTFINCESIFAAT